MRNLSYPVSSYRLHPETCESLKRIKNELGISWNKTLYYLINMYDNCGTHPSNTLPAVSKIKTRKEKFNDLVSRHFEITKKVIERDGFFCNYCGNSCLNDYEIDHVIPKSKGGSTTVENLAMSCMSCNRIKKDSTPFGKSKNNEDRESFSKNENEVMPIIGGAEESPIPITVVQKKWEKESDEYRLADFMYRSILKNDEKAKKPNLQKWSEVFDKMKRLDGRETEEIVAVIRYAHAHEFWASNILSPKKLREQFTKLTVQMKGEAHKYFKKKEEEKKKNKSYSLYL